MDNSPPDDSRLDDAEARMRRALGLGGNSTPIAERTHPTASPADHFRRRGKFVRDGDVQVEIVHRNHQPANGEANPLDAARQNIRALATAKERAERSLSDAQAQIHDLQTKLGHERLAKDEAIARADADRKAVEQVLQSLRNELAAEKIARERSKQALRDAHRTISDLTERLHIAQQAGRRVDAGSASRTAQKTAGRSIVIDRQQAASKARKAVGRPRKATVEKAVEMRAKKAREKPVKWWLGTR